MEPNGDERVLLATLVIEVTMDDEGREAAVARAEAHAKGATRANLDRDTAYEELTAMTIRAEAAERDRDYARARLREVCSIAAVSHDEVKQAMQGQWGGSFDAILDAVWSLVSGSDPAVYVVRESGLPAARADGDYYVVEDPKGDYRWPKHGASWWEDRAQDALTKAARFTALARLAAREAVVDPVEAQARELAAAGGIDFDEQEPDGVEMLFGMARHVLGLEADQ